MGYLVTGRTGITSARVATKVAMVAEGVLKHLHPLLPVLDVGRPNTRRVIRAAGQMGKRAPTVKRWGTSVLFVQTHQVMEGGLPRDPQLSPTQMVRLPSSVRRNPPRVTLVVTLGLRLTLMSSQGVSLPLAVSRALFQMRS